MTREWKIMRLYRGLNMYLQMDEFWWFFRSSWPVSRALAAKLGHNSDLKQLLQALHTIKKEYELRTAKTVQNRMGGTVAWFSFPPNIGVFKWYYTKNRLLGT